MATFNDKETSLEEKKNEIFKQITLLRGKLQPLTREYSYPYREIEQGGIWNRNIAINKILNPLIDEFNAILDMEKK